MSQKEITILRVRKRTRNRLRKKAITRRESYDEIINRLLGEETEAENRDDLAERRQRLLRMGIDKDLVDLAGIVPKSDMKEEKELIRIAIRKWASKR